MLDLKQLYSLLDLNEFLTLAELRKGNKASMERLMELSNHRAIVKDEIIALLAA